MLTSSKKTKERKELDFEPMSLLLKPKDKKEIEKIIEDPQMKSQIIDKIMKAFSIFQKDQLNTLSIKNLLKISITLKFNFSNLNRLKAPENASNDIKEFAQNLENLKREREIQEEFKRFQDCVQSEEVKTF